MGLTLVMLFSADVFPMLPEMHETVGGFRESLLWMNISQDWFSPIVCQVSRSPLGSIMKN